MVACGGNAPETSSEQPINSAKDAEPAPEQAKDYVIGYTVPDTANPFLGWLTSSVTELAAKDGVKVIVADAGNNSVKQIEQIENFIAMNVNAIDIMPIDPNNVADVIGRAQSAGIKVLVAGTETEKYDVMMNMDQYNSGEQISEMAIDWLVKTFSTDGTEATMPREKVIILKCTETTDMVNRSNGIIDKITKWGKVDVVVATSEARTAAAATAVMENMWQQNSDAVAVLCYNADSGLGVNEYIMGQANVDKSKFGVYAGDWSEDLQQLLNDSLTDKAVLRGLMRIVGPQIDGEQVPLDEATYRVLKGLCDGTWTTGNVVDTIQKTFGE